MLVIPAGVTISTVRPDVESVMESEWEPEYVEALVRGLKRAAGIFAGV